MSQRVAGGCACGAVRYECSAEPLLTPNCHCRDCQRATGSAFASVLFVPTAAFKLTKGEPKYYRVTADSGNTRDLGFCPTCGSPVLINPSADPSLVIIQAASLDDLSWLRPAVDIFTSSAQPWDHMNPALPKFEREPTRDQLQEILTPRG
jgi:hypothetical protein